MGLEVPLERLNVTAAATLVGWQRAARQASRDPRAAPVSIRQNISIVETCRFYGAADALTSCRVPRSCQDCLAMPNCLLGFSGRCYDVSESFVAEAHAVTFPNSTSTTRPLVNEDPKAFFYGTNTTYCPASDPICRDCRVTFERTAQSFRARRVGDLEKQYCVGTGGCVCLGICEVPSLMATRVHDYDCGQPVPDYVGARDPSLSTSGHRDPRAPFVQLTSRKKPETCEFYGSQDVQGCRVPRSCRDCLETEGCMLFGHKCVGMTKYDPMLDYRNATRPTSAFNLQFEWNGSAIVQTSSLLCSPQIQFPSSNTSYCPLSDVTCAKCRAGFISSTLAGSQLSTPRPCYATNTTFCVGVDGCVCVEQCEDTTFFMEDGRDQVCAIMQPSEGIRVGVLVGAVASVMLTLLSFVVWKFYHSRPVGGYRQAAVVMMRHMIDQAPGLHLDLFGWRQHQQNLLDKEQELLSGATNVSPVARPHVDFDCIDASAPDFEEDDSSAPTASDPHALASAPVFRREDATQRGAGHDELDANASIPSAPDLTTL